MSNLVNAHINKIKREKWKKKQIRQTILKWINDTKIKNTIKKLKKKMKEKTIRKLLLYKNKKK